MDKETSPQIVVVGTANEAKEKVKAHLMKCFSELCDDEKIPIPSTVVTHHSPPQAGFSDSGERIIQAIEETPWLITEGSMETIRTIATRSNSPEVISQFVGKPYDHEGLVTMHDATAVVSVKGPMMRYANLFTRFSGATSTEMASAAFGQLLQDESVEKIILQFDTPGGQANGIAEFGEMIANAKKPVIGYATGDCCSAGYWLASQCDSLVVSSTAIVGCIGVLGRAPRKQDDDVLSSKYAPAKIGNRAATQDMIDDLEAVFLSAVAEGRGVDLEHVQENFGQGGVFVGAKAVAAELADAVGTLDKLLSFDRPEPQGNSNSSFMGGHMPNNDDTKNAGGIPVAEHEAAVKAAKQSGIEEAEAKTELAVADAISVERKRFSAILESGKDKPKMALHLAMSGVDAESAKATLEVMQPESELSNRMNGTNPKIANDPNPDDDDAELKASRDGWADVVGAN